MFGVDKAKKSAILRALFQVFAITFISNKNSDIQPFGELFIIKWNRICVNSRPYHWIFSYKMSINCWKRFYCEIFLRIKIFFCFWDLWVLSLKLEWFCHLWADFNSLGVKKNEVFQSCYFYWFHPVDIFQKSWFHL